MSDNARFRQVMLPDAKICPGKILPMVVQAHSETMKDSNPDWVSLAFKVFLFVLPPTLIEQFNPRGHSTLYGASLIVGALLQALFPPHRYRF